MPAIRPIRLFVMAVLATSAAYAGDAGDAKADAATVDAAKADAPKADAMPAGTSVANVPKGDPAKGQELFMATACIACHGITKDDTSKVGPSLFGVIGRQAGTAKSLLGASENLKKYGVIWSAETLDEFLANPDAKVPGTPMVGVLADPQQRADVIAYLASLKE